MNDIMKIMKMLDWNAPDEVQDEGIFLASQWTTIRPFILPVTSEFNKNTWGNCAVIISKKSDEELKPYLLELLEWLQDMNWPGAFVILKRLKEYEHQNALNVAIKESVSHAFDTDDVVWQENLQLIKNQ